MHWLIPCHSSPLPSMTNCRSTTELMLSPQLGIGQTIARARRKRAQGILFPERVLEQYILPLPCAILLWFVNAAMDMIDRPCLIKSPNQHLIIKCPQMFVYIFDWQMFGEHVCRVVLHKNPICLNIAYFQLLLNPQPMGNNVLQITQTLALCDGCAADCNVTQKSAARFTTPGVWHVHFNNSSNPTSTELSAIICCVDDQRFTS